MVYMCECELKLTYLFSAQLEYFSMMLRSHPNAVQSKDFATNTLAQIVLWELLQHVLLSPNTVRYLLSLNSSVDLPQLLTLF